MTFHFDATKIDPTNEFDPVPAGNYVAEIEDAELKDTKAGTGQYINFKFNIIDGPLSGRKVFQNINVSNANAQAESIGQKQLSQLCHAVDFLKLKSERDLIGRVCKIKVGIRQGTNGYSDQNEIKAFEAVQAATKPTPSAPPSRRAEPANAAPWK